jgi:hypothetical protein
MLPEKYKLNINKLPQKIYIQYMLKYYTALLKPAYAEIHCCKENQCLI